MIIHGLVWFYAILNIQAQFGAAQYVPGQPGADWTEAEVLVVKAKLIQVISNGGNAMNQVNPNHNWTWTRYPNAAKFVRLGFHDCLKSAPARPLVML